MGSSQRTHDQAHPYQVKKRVRHVRVRTGCLECRTRRVKCVEGERTATNTKAPCLQCLETDTECFYPDPSTPKAWLKAGTPMLQSSGRITVIASPKHQVEPQTSSQLELVSYTTDVGEPSAQTSQTVDEMAAALQGLLDSLGDQRIIDYPPTATISYPEWKSLINPAPTFPLTTFTLSALPSHGVDRAAVSYFEAHGCNEIVAAPNHRSNWIYTVLFPRLYTMLSGPRPQDGGEAAVHDFVYHSLLRLSSVHRSNMEGDTQKGAEYREQAVQHRRVALYAALKARVGYPEASWKTEKYLSGFFVLCMADMLGSESFNIDTNNAFEFYEAPSDYSQSLRDMIGVYSTIHTACTPHEPGRNVQPFSTGVPFELAPTGSEWVERFFGVSRRMIILIGQVNRLVGTRISLLRQGLEGSILGDAVRKEAEQLLISLNSRQTWHEEWVEAFHTRRIERGSLVTRSALVILLLCEVLAVELDDPRVKNARSSAIELVADTEPQETAGYTWYLSLAGVYCDDKDERTTLQAVLRAAQRSSFGAGYRGADEILQWCWEELDRNGCYRDGIAPWRDALSASGRSMYV